MRMTRFARQVCIILLRYLAVAVSVLCVRFRCDSLQTSVNGNLPGLLKPSIVSLVFCNFHRWNMRKRTGVNIIRYDFSHFYYEEIVRI